MDAGVRLILQRNTHIANESLTQITVACFAHFRPPAVALSHGAKPGSLWGGQGEGIGAIRSGPTPQPDRALGPSSRGPGLRGQPAPLLLMGHATPALSPVASAVLAAPVLNHTPFAQRSTAQQAGHRLRAHLPLPSLAQATHAHQEMREPRRLFSRLAMTDGMDRLSGDPPLQLGWVTRGAGSSG